MADPWDTPPPAQQTATPEPWNTPAPSLAPTPNSPEAEKLVEQHVLNSPGVKTAENPLDAFSAGLQMSASVIPFHKPGMALDAKTASFWQKLSYAAGESLGDLPVTIPAALGMSAATAEETGGTGSVPASMAAGFAVPQAVRETMMDYYDRGERHTWGDFFSTVGQNAWNITKAGVTGYLGGKAGEVAGGIVSGYGGSQFAQNVANKTAFVTTTAGAGAGLDGRMPDGADFESAAIIALGFHVAESAMGRPAYANPREQQTAMRVADNMAKVYRQTGVPPWEQANRMKTDPAYRDEILAKDVNGDPVAPKANATRPPEEEPFKTNAFKVMDEHQQEIESLTGEAHVRAHVEQLLPQVRALEGSADDAVSPAGAIGRYQIMPGTARQYGFDPARLTDPVYNEHVARTILTDLSRRFHGDTRQVMIAYNAGPGRALTFAREGSDESTLPRETQNYLTHARKLGFDIETPGGGGKPPAEPPKEPPAGEEEPDWSKASDETLRSRFANRIGEDQPKEKSASLGMQFELTPLHKIDQMLETKGLIDTDKDVGLEDMARMRYSSSDRANSFLTYRPVDALDFNREMEGPTLKSVMDDIDTAGGTWNDFARYVSSLRSVEKAKQGIDTGLFKPGEAEENVNRLAAKYDPINERFQKFNDGVLQYGHDSGLYSAGQMQAMRDGNLMSYISMRRVMGDDVPFGYGGKGPLARNRNPLRMMEGSDRNIVDQRLATMDNTRKLVAAADTNRFLGYVIGSTRLRGELGLKQLPFDANATLVEPGSDVFKPYHISAPEEDAVRHFAVKASANSGRTFVYYNEGKPELWEAQNDEMARLLRGASSPQEATILGKVMQLPAALDRAGVVSAPDFGFRVGLKHQVTAWLTEPSSPPPFLTMIRGLHDVLGKTDEYQRALRNGALNGVITDIDKNIADQDTLRQTGVFERAWNVAQHPLEAARMVTETLSNAARIGTMRHIEAQGVEPFKAAQRARKAMLDYKEPLTSNDQQLAAFLQTWAHWVPFFRPAALGVRNAKEAILERPGQTMSKVAMGLILPQIALYAMNRAQDQQLPESEKYENLPQWERDQFYVLPQVQGVRIKIPKPYVFGPIFGTVTERILQSTFESDPHAWDDVVQGMSADVFPGVIPAAVKPVVEAQTNYNFYTGHPLVSDSLKENTRDLQYTDNTTPIAKKLSALLGGHDQIGVGTDSPPVLENYVREWSGTVGMTALQLLSTPFKQTTPPSTIADTPFIKSFLIRNPGMSAKPIDDFYKDASYFAAKNKDVMKEVREDERTGAQKDYDEGHAKAAFSMRVERAFGVMRQAIHAVDERKDMQDAEKQQLEERIWNDAIAIAKYASHVMRSDATDEERAAALASQGQADVQAAAPQ